MIRDIMKISDIIQVVWMHFLTVWVCPYGTPCTFFFIKLHLVLYINLPFNHRIASDYNVNTVEKGGNENRAYEIEAERKVSAAPESNDKAEDKSNKTAETEQKWVSNYVPYGDYPKGNIVYVKEVSIVILFLFYAQK